MTKKYVVVETDFEYNDEVYYAEYTGGTPVIIHSDEDKAEAECVERNLEKLKLEDLGSYGYGLGEVLNEPGFSVVKEAIHRGDVDEYEINVGTLSDDDLKVIAASLRTPFFSVYEVEEAS